MRCNVHLPSGIDGRNQDGFLWSLAIGDDRFHHFGFLDMFLNGCCIDGH